MAVTSLDWSAVWAGTRADLAVLVPVVAVYAVLHGTGTIHGDAGTVATAVIAVLVAPAVGGWVTSHRAPPGSPLKHAATATAIAALAYVAFRGIDAVVRDRPLNGASVAAFVIVSVVVGVLGGGAAQVHRRPKAGGSADGQAS
ncbi:MAG TPA: hypothetical protein VFA84_14220 [Acidimicrobiales bacterium]|nr:hypothetical protein [Acidimicrobiales bacterium]